MSFDSFTGLQTHCKCCDGIESLMIQKSW